MIIHDSTEAKHLCIRDYVNALSPSNCREGMVLSYLMLCNKVLKDSSGRCEACPLYSTTRASATTHALVHEERSTQPLTL